MMQPTIKTERVDLPNYHLQQQQIQLQQQQRQQRLAPRANTTSAKTTAHHTPQCSKTNTSVSESIENQPDFQSIKGVFGWTSIDNVNVPYILRADKQFVSVRIVEMKLLNRYPNSYPDDLGKHAPLTSFFITPNEAKLLNEINLQHCGGEYGKKEFTSKELIVQLSDFIRFYDLVKKTFPDAAAARREAIETAGWLQIKNTVTPYITRSDGKYVPLSVIQYAAGLLTNERVSGLQPTKRECELLNEACKTAGVEFVFSDATTRFINISDILKLSPVDITELPSSNPLKHAAYMELPTTSNQRTSEKTKVTLDSVPSQPNSGHLSSFQHSSKTNSHQVLKTVSSQVAPVSHFQQQHQQQSGFPVFDNMVDSRLNDIMKMHCGAQTRPVISNGPPNMRLGQVPFSSMARQINPVMQYYINMQNGQQQTQRQQMPINQPKVVSQPLNNCNPEMNISRSPGASSNPSPRSRPPSQPRPSPGSRPPSASPMSPNGHQYPRDVPFPQNVMSPVSLNQPSSNGSLAIQQIQNMFPQQFPMPKASVSLNTVSSSSETPIVHNVLNAFEPTPQIRNPYQDKQQMHYQSLQANQQPSANQELPGLFSPTGTNVSINRQKELGPNKTDNKSPPPLRLMTESLSGLTQGDSCKDTDDVQSPPIKTQPLPTTISAAKTEIPLVNSIKGAWLNNKSISCLYLEHGKDRNGRFCLVEAVCKLYFNGCSVNEFLFALENVLNVPLLTCNEMEEKAFIQYYSLPVVTLKCNKMIKFDDLDKYFPQLTYMFPSKEAIAQSESEIEEPVFTTEELEAPISADTDIANQRGLKRPGDNTNEAPSSKQQFVGGR